MINRWLPGTEWAGVLSNEIKVNHIDEHCLRAGKGIHNGFVRLGCCSIHNSIFLKTVNIFDKRFMMLTKQPSLICTS